MTENTEINRFYSNLKQDIQATQLSAEEGGSTEQIFTQLAVDLLSTAGETDNVRLAYDKKGIGTKTQHQINAYSISDNYETLDLFVTVLKSTDHPERTTKAEVDTAQKRILNFFRKAIYKDYVNEIEESSDIFQLANELASSEELRNNLVRVNTIILTDGFYPNELSKVDSISGYSIYPRIVDINYLYNITEKSHIPIEIDFKSEGFIIPCIESPSANSGYKSYLAIIPGNALATIYERFGSRLLEQNVRSFLQFSGKINKGIRNTILNEPHMFLAFNNGIAATAESIELENTENGLVITKTNDLQIVNGGQTTASIYHTFKKDKADLSDIYVQVKLSVIENKEKYGDIVSRIAEYANTQNRVSVADLSSNLPYHVHFEKLSRTIITPHSDTKPTQTKWFYERARGQYRNARNREGFTKARRKAFDIKHPRSQMFTKEKLAKYINAYQEVYKGTKLVVAPHFVVKNVKNYSQFILYNTKGKIENNNIYFEDTVAKAILYQTCEKLYGVKPNSIGGLRFIVVPYAITYFGLKTDYKLDLYKIWRNQAISDNLSNLLYDLMVQLDDFLVRNSPESLIEMWARKESCWELVREQDFKLDYNSIKEDFINPNETSKRKLMSSDESKKRERESNIEKLKSIPIEKWDEISRLDIETKKIKSLSLKNKAIGIYASLKQKKELSDLQINDGLRIIEAISTQVPDFFDTPIKKDVQIQSKTPKIINTELLMKMIEWDTSAKVLSIKEQQYIADFAYGLKKINDFHRKNIEIYLQKLKNAGFRE